MYLNVDKRNWLHLQPLTLKRFSKLNSFFFLVYIQSRQESVMNNIVSSNKQKKLGGQHFSEQLYVSAENASWSIYKYLNYIIINYYYL